MSAYNQVLAKVHTDGEVLVSSVNLGFETLMIVHQQLNARHVTAAHAPCGHTVWHSTGVNTVPYCHTVWYSILHHVVTQPCSSQLSLQLEDLRDWHWMEFQHSYKFLSFRDALQTKQPVWWHCSSNNKKAQLTLSNPRDVKACKNCSNSTCFVSFHRIPFPQIANA